MYREWASLSPRLLNGSEEGHSVLEKFPGNAGKDVALAIIRQLASNVGISQPPQPSNLITDREVQWCMEVICFGLSLPLSEHDTIRDCVNVYCEWLSALQPSPKISVPKPVVEDPDLYARRIIAHFHNLFIPRKGEAWTFLYSDLGADTINRQAVLCHRVLRTLQHIAQTSTTLSRDTWEALLLFLLAINDTLLAPPTVKDDVGDQLCERVLSVLLEVWLLACARCFPSPPLWKTLREMCHNWRHRVALVEQWNRVNLALTSRLIQFMYGPTFPELKIPEEDAQLVPADMTPDCISQSWFRFLHTLGNPAQLCRPGVISHTQKFLQYALASDSVVDPCQHPCLSALPVIFLKAIRGVAGQVDAFLGIAHCMHMDFGLLSEKERKDGYSSPFSSPSLHTGGSQTSCPSPLSSTPTPVPTRRLAKSFSVTPSTVTKGIPKSALIGLTSSRASHHNPPTPNSGPSSTSSLSSIVSLGSEFRNALAPSRPKCNSILHLFGEWLFEAAQIGCESAYASRVNATRSETGSSKRPNSVLMDSTARKGSSSVVSLSQPGSLSLSLSDDTESLSATVADRYQAGRAEAMGALCRIFCAKKTGEEILPVYLARFYLTLQQGLRVGEGSECSEVLASILLNSADLFRLDLDGVQVLLPYVIDALEEVLPDKELKLRSNTVSRTELRRASIHLLLSVLVLPLHFQNLTIKDLNPNTGMGCSDRTPLTFSQLKPRLMNLLINALQVESDPQNTQMLLGGLLLSVQDSAAFELSDQVSQPDAGNSGLTTSDSASNLLSSASDTMSSLSLPSLTPSHGEEIVDGAESDRDPGSALSWFERFDQPPCCGINKYSAHALFVRATYLVCHRLISSWKTDLNVSLAALELLSGLARISIKETDSLECKRAVKWLCDYIVYQCWRPPPAHSKDLHSTIVAAFQCCAIWLVAHPYLLKDKECLGTVLEVVELGISGSKSVGKPGEPVKMKDEKELKPASMRVRDSAEALLTVVLEQVGCFPSPCGAESLSSLLDEVSLLRHCNSWPTPGGGPAASSRAAAVQRFRYFVLENSTVLALLEEPLGNDQDPQPTVTVLIRGPFGRHAWAMQLRHLPRHKSGLPHKVSMAGCGMSPGRPVPMADQSTYHSSAHRHFPESVDRIPHCKIDKSIPSLDSLLSNETTAMEHTRLAQLIEKQASLEAGGSLGANSTPLSASASRNASCQDEPFGVSGGLEKECTPPPVVHDFQTARLFLSHFGFLSLDSLQDCVTSPVPPLTALDACNPNFCADLEALDNIGVRTCDTAHVFYVRAGQKTASEIVDNVLSESSVDAHFLEMLLCLGWPVDVHQHPGWTGHISTSWKVHPPPIVEQWVSTDHGGSLYNGDTQALYWADVSSEIAFVVPTANNMGSGFHGTDAERSDPNMSINTSSCSLTSAPSQQQQQLPSSRGWYERSVSDCGGVNAVARSLKSSAMPGGPDRGRDQGTDRHTALNLDKPRAFSLDLDKGALPQTQTGPPGSSDSGRRRTGTSRGGPPPHAPTKVMIIWLESFEDNVYVPLSDLLAYTSTGLELPSIPSDSSLSADKDCFVIFLHALPSGLLRVKLQGPQGRMSLATPLVDGMVVSRRALGPLVRQTALNMCRRRRLDNDSYQPPHVRRRLKVQELVSKYRTHMTEAELLTYLFHDPPL
ncbi:ral GTPase-activating protein subunit beta isoform X1 [Thrips palmi]|nr:ral GTPase-activating protein subunit beta isoform X1 [Thrips palmi]